MKCIARLLLMMAFSFPNLHCTNTNQQLGEGSSKQAASIEVDSIKVRVPGKVSIIDDDLLMVIDNKEKIDKIVRFTNTQLQDKAGWRPEWDGHSVAPHHFLKLTFYKDNEIIGGFGIARDPFFSTSDPETGYRIKYVSRAKFLELIELIGLSEEEWRKLEREFDQPGPWKKR